MLHADDGTLHAYLDGELSALEVARLEAHLADCAPCRARLEEEKNVVTRASRILALAEPPEHTAPPLHRLRHPRLAWRIRMPLAWAASLVVALGAGWFAFGTLSDRASRSAVTAPPPEAQNYRLSADSLASPPAPRAARPSPLAEAVGPPPPSAGVAAPPAQIQAPPPALDTSPGAAFPQALYGERARVDSAALRREAQAVADAAAAAPPVVALEGRLQVRGQVRGDAIELDSARTLLGGDVLALPGLPVRSVRRERMIGYSAVIVVEQALDSTRTIEIVHRRPLGLALDAVTVTAGAARVVPKADSAPLPAPPPEPALARQARTPLPNRYMMGPIEVEIRGSVAADSLGKLQRQLRPIR